MFRNIRKTRFGMRDGRRDRRRNVRLLVDGERRRQAASTTLTLDPGSRRALTSLGVSVAPVAPATAGPAGVSFPVTGVGGSLWPFALKINHSGGLALCGWRDHRRADQLHDPAGQEADVDRHGRRRSVAILSLDLKKAKISIRGRSVTVGPVKASLTAAAAGALNGAFGVTAFNEGLVLGTANVKLTLWRQLRD